MLKMCIMEPETGVSACDLVDVSLSEKEHF
jgi:hypothetical protein